MFSTFLETLRKVLLYPQGSSTNVDTDRFDIDNSDRHETITPPREDDSDSNFNPAEGFVEAGTSEISTAAEDKQWEC